MAVGHQVAQFGMFALQPLFLAGGGAIAGETPPGLSARLHAGEVDGRSADCGAPVGDGLMKQAEHQTVRSEIGFLDCAVIVAIQCLAQNFVGLALHGIKLLDGIGLAG
jgi:hypothetical protein